MTFGWKRMRLLVLDEPGADEGGREVDAVEGAAVLGERTRPRAPQRSAAGRPCPSGSGIDAARVDGAAPVREPITRWPPSHVVPLHEPPPPPPLRCQLPTYGPGSPTLSQLTIARSAGPLSALTQMSHGSRRRPPSESRRPPSRPRRASTRSWQMVAGARMGRFHRASYASGVCVCAKATYRKSGGAGAAFMLITSRARAAYRVLSMNGSYGCSTIESEQQHARRRNRGRCVSYSGIATQPPSAVPPLTPQPPWRTSSSRQSAGHDGVPCVRSSPPSTTAASCRGSPCRPSMAARTTSRTHGT